MEHRAKNSVLFNKSPRSPVNGYSVETKYGVSHGRKSGWWGRQVSRPAPQIKNEK